MLKIGVVGGIKIYGGNSMKNEIKLSGTQEFMGKEIPIIEGGFGDNCKIIFAKTIAEIHGSRLDKVNELINNNIDEFEIGVDLMDLCCDEKSLNLAKGLGFISNNRQKNCFLLSEQGYMLLVGFMKTEKSKEIRKQLRREYFTMREVIKNNNHVKYELYDKIIMGGLEALAYAGELIKIETKELREENEVLKPKAEYHDEVLNKNGLMTTTDVAKSLGFKSANVLSNLLQEHGIQYKQSGKWLLRSNYTWLENKDYAGYRHYSHEKSKPSLQWTELGMHWLREFLIEKGENVA